MSSTKRKIEDVVTRPYILKLEQQRKAIHEFVDRDSTSIVMQYMPELPSRDTHSKFACVTGDLEFSEYLHSTMYKQFKHRFDLLRNYCWIGSGRHTHDYNEVECSLNLCNIYKVVYDINLKI
jgi:hypothetical protein